MAGSSEPTEFRRAFVWLLCGMLLPSVALVAFGVVVVANERATVERRLTDDYQGRLLALQHDLTDRLDEAARVVAATPQRDLPSEDEPVSSNATGVAAKVEATAGVAQSGAAREATQTIPGGAQDPLVSVVRPLNDAATAADPTLLEASRRAANLPLGGHLFVSSDAFGERRAYALVRVAKRVGERTVTAQLDLARIAVEIGRLARERFPRDGATFRLVPPRELPGGLTAFRRMVADVTPTADPASTIARLALQPPFEGFALAAEISGDDPAAALAFRNRTWYILALGLLYSGIGVGFGLTIREMRRGMKLSRLKTDFVANISHELRTPLTSVRLFAETLKEGRAESPEEVQECLDILSSEAERLSNLVEKLLDWSRLESGRKILHREVTQVPRLLERVGEIFRAQQLRATYETELEPDLPEVSIDRDAMAQVVLNLLHNAVKYTGDEKRIRLRARRKGAGVAIEVEDNGPGVRPQDRKKIFERFYRADDLLSRNTEGTGLGLAISKRIVEAHGGRIELDSRLGKGSTFRVVIPQGPD